MNDTLDTNFAADESTRLNAESKSHLVEAAKWAKFLAIVGFVMLALFFIASLVILGEVFSKGFNWDSIGGFAVGMVMVAVYFFPIYYMFSFARKIKKGIRESSEEDCVKGFEHLKSMFKFMGIMFVIIIALYILIFIFALFLGLAGAF